MALIRRQILLAAAVGLLLGLADGLIISSSKSRRAGAPSTLIDIM
jgi:hypothetical protein